MRLIENASKEKLRGGFYTPKPIADFILSWAINSNHDYDILEPSCGDGIFFEVIKEKNYKYKSITGVELIEEEAKKANKIDIKNKVVLNTDFHKFCNGTSSKFDLIVGNPPYIRYQYFDKDQRIEAETIFKKADLKYSKLTNAWVSFVIGSILLLKDNGKIGFVLPAELLQVTYAKQIRDHLTKFFNYISIVSFKKLVFPKIQQEIILLLCEKNASYDSHLIEHIEVKDISELKSLDMKKLKTPNKKIDFKNNKWTFYFLEQEEIDFIEKIQSQNLISPLSTYAKAEVGITTGSNHFFTVNKSIIEEYNLEKYAYPMVGRSIQVPGIIFTNKDWTMNVNQGAKSYLLIFPFLNELRFNNKAIDYIKKGDEQNIKKFYKCSIRKEWQIVPSTWISEALFIRRSHIFPKIIINEAKAYTTDTMHRVTIDKNNKIIFDQNINLKAFVASYYNSISFAFAEICGRSHGGGVLELMPNEVENIPVPYREDNAFLLEIIDKKMRNGESIDTILEYTDKTILKKGFRFTDYEIQLANKIWKKLLKRRLDRC